MSMRELNLSKKGSQKQLAVPKLNVANSSPGTSTSSGARRKLFIGANDNEEDDVSFQDMNEADGDKDYEDDENEDINNAYEDDENEDIDNTILRNGIEGNDGISQEIEFISDEDDNRQDGVEDDLGTEDDEPAQVQVIAYRSTKETVVSKTKNRGPTMLHRIHTRSFDEREDIICNEFGQPIGPIINGKDIAGEFSRFLGTVARNYSYAPLIHASWHKVPHKEKIWEYVLKKYNVPKEAKDWVLQTIGASWRVNKCRIKSRHFYKYKDNSSRWKNRPKYVPEKDFQTMLRLWNNKETMKRCSLARDRRNSQKNNHTAGPKSFARIREELKNEDPNKEPPTLSKMFDYTRRRKEGNSYVDSFDDTASKIEKMKNYKPCEEEPSDEVNPFLAVMGKEYSGHRRIYGKGVTNTLIKRVSGGEICNIAPSKPIDVEAEKRLILDMRRELNEEHERKKRELEEDHQRKKAELEAIRKDVDNQRDNSIENAVKNILQKLPFGIVQDFLT